MISLVKSQANHYDVLGLTPSAGEGEIALAFARKMGMFGAHEVGDAARICAAYETLRDPAKRRDYDRSIGIGTKAEAPRQWAFAVTQQQWPGFARAASAALPAEQQVAPKPEPPPAPQVERASAIAERLRRLAEPLEYDGMAEPAPQQRAAPQPAPQAAPEQPRVVEEARRAPETDIYRILARGEEVGRSRDDRLPFEWRRPALVVGGLVAAPGLVGALAGFSVKDDAASAITVPLPAAKQVAQAAPVPAAPPVAAAVVEAAQTTPLPTTAPVMRHAAPPSRFARAVERKLSAGDVQPVEVAAAAAEPGADAGAAQMVEASMPLPNNVVARTIEKIGYSCGSVASTAAVEGASGVFKVTCSSGQSYQATPVHGRYRFRRSGG